MLRNTAVFARLSVGKKAEDDKATYSCKYSLNKNCEKQNFMNLLCKEAVHMLMSQSQDDELQSICYGKHFSSRIILGQWL